MAKLEELLENEEFNSKLESVTNGEDAKAVLNEYGIETDAELNEEALSDVVGGVSFSSALSWVVKNVDWVNYGWQGAKIAARCLYDYAQYGNMWRTYSKDYVSRFSKKLEQSIPNWVKKFG